MIFLLVYSSVQYGQHLQYCIFFNREVGDSGKGRRGERTEVDDV